MNLTHKGAPSVDLFTMGCSKNLVDSERLIKRFEENGFVVRHDPKAPKADYIIVNTCGFISDAKEESINMILECCEAKKRHRGRKVYVMGCLSQRYAEELPKEIPEVDGWYGKFQWDKVITDVCADLNSQPLPLFREWDRSITTPSHHAYLKIAEGCNRFCAFCAIPLITGRYVSRPIEEIVEEVKSLVSIGVKEFNVLAQDLSYYGTDLYGNQRIADLVEAVAAIPGVEWIRLHYAYPSQFPYDLLPVMGKHDNVCKYLDIALQHISDNVLENMRRHISGDETRALLQRIRKEVPGIHIRTTLMVGFPGEGDKEFGELMDFVKEQRFERMGAFAYCQEDDTWAAKNLSDTVPQEEKERRLDELMALQELIATEHNESKIGMQLRVIIDSESDDYYVGRSQYDSPEVDQEVLIEKTIPMQVGSFYDIIVTEASAFDLIGRVV